jgi:hypothetical protein
MDQRIQMRRLGQQQLLVSAGRFLGPALAMQRQRPLEFQYDYPGFARPAGILAPSGRNVPARPSWSAINSRFREHPIALKADYE